MPFSSVAVLTAAKQKYIIVNAVYVGYFVSTPCRLLPRIYCMRIRIVGGGGGGTGKSSRKPHSGGPLMCPSSQHMKPQAGKKAAFLPFGIFMFEVLTGGYGSILSVFQHF